MANLQPGFTKKDTNKIITKKSETCRDSSGKQSVQTSKDIITALVPYTVPHNHPYISSYKPGLLRYLYTAATYVGMVVSDGVGY